MKKAVKLLATSLVAMSAHAAMAEPGNWYVGVGVGRSNYNDWSSRSDMLNLMDGFGTRVGVSSFVGSREASVDDGDFAFKLFGGYSFNPYVAAELSYIDMGRVEAHSHASGTFYDAMNNSLDGDLSATAKASIKAFALDGKVSYPLGRVVALSARIGVYQADTDLKLNAAGSISSESYSYSKTESSTGLHYGVGADFTITPMLGLRAEWERLDGVEANKGENNVDLLSAALVYSF